MTIETPSQNNFMGESQTANNSHNSVVFSRIRNSAGAEIYCGMMSQEDHNKLIAKLKIVLRKSGKKISTATSSEIIDAIYQTRNMVIDWAQEIRRVEEEFERRTQELIAREIARRAHENT